MTIDPTMLASLAGNFVTVGALSWALISRGNLKIVARAREEEILGNLATINTIIAERDALFTQVEACKAKEADRRAKAKKASLAGHAVQSAKAAERRAKATEKTVAALNGTLGAMRSRAQVVAPVKAARTRKIKQESGAGSAA